MAKKVIAVDIDEVLSPLHDLLFEHHNQVYGTNFALRDPNGSYFFSDYTGDSDEVARQKIKKFIDTEAFKNVKPLTDAVEAIAKLLEKYEMIVITSRQDFYFDITHQWLSRHFPNVFSGVHFTDYEVGTGLKVLKSKVGKDNNASYLIDDNLDIAIESAESGLDVLLFGDYPWNQMQELPGNITRVKDWQEVLEYFDGRD